VRELLNAIHRSFLTSSSQLLELDLALESPNPLSFEEATKRFQAGFLRWALAQHGDNKDRCAEALGMSRSTLFRYLGQFEELEFKKELESKKEARQWEILGALDLKIGILSSLASCVSGAWLIV